VWQGGLGIWGGIFGALLGLFMSTRKTRKLFAYVDIFAVGAPLAQAIGRWGNYFNKELFGLPTNLPWGIYIPFEFRPPINKYFDHFHPLFLYESLLCLILFVFLYKIFSRQKLFGKVISPGNIGIIYLIGYSFIRFFLEFLRTDPWKLVGVPVASLVAIVIVPILLILRKFITG
jgi:phosphatidylglycerol:prolipoprotein diacylglycerol transferase